MPRRRARPVEEIAFFASPENLQKIAGGLLDMANDENYIGHINIDIPRSESILHAEGNLRIVIFRKQ